jgi:hypothetical protein
MTDLFEDDEEVSAVSELSADEEVDPEVMDGSLCNLDARRRLEQLLEEKRLREELDDFC